MVWILLRAHLYGAGVIGVFLVALPLLARGLDPILGGALPGAAGPLGYALAVAGALLSYDSFLGLVLRGHGTAFPTDPPRQFVVAGPYRWVRNPMYHGNLLVVLGLAAVLRSPGIAMYWALLFLVTHWYVVRVEEPRLAQRFGDRYADFRRRVGRWMPRRPMPDRP